MKYKFDSGYVYLVLALFVVVAISGCDKDELAGPATQEISGSLVGHSDCNLLADGPGVPLNQTAVVWVYDGKGNLELHHLNAAFNCCPVISCEFVIEDNSITVSEIDAGMCDCLCLTDAFFKVKGLSAGTYNIGFEETYFREGDEKIEFSIILSASPKCDTVFVDRNHYPWLPVEEPFGVLKDYSDCGGFDDEQYGFFVLPDSVCILWDFNDGTLDLRQVNTYFNCCLDYIQVQITVDDNFILIREFEVAPNPCFCICPYDIDMEIYNLSPDTYTMLIQVPDCTEFWGTLNLIDEPEGSRCFFSVLPWEIEE